MSSGVWNYVLGYVIISVRGRSLERFVNLCVSKGIRVWAIRRTRANELTASVMCEDFYKLKPILRQSRCRVHILSKHGAPFLYVRNRARGMLLLSSIVLAIALLAVSRFIWAIDIRGCVNVERAEVLTLLQELDIAPGITRNSVSTSRIGNELKQRDERIAWAGAEIEGVRLVIDIVEADGRSQQDASGPNSVYAACDGIITSIIAIEGKPVVTAGQAVKKGDLLIEGNLVDTEGAQLQVSARGTVLANVLYTLSYAFPPDSPYIMRSGASGSAARVGIFGWQLESRDAFASSETEWSRKVNVEGLMLPIEFEFGTRYELSGSSGAVVGEQALLNASELATRMALEEMPEDGRIITKVTETDIKDDGAIAVVVRLVVQRDIGVAGPVLRRDVSGDEE
ncbi:MAG: sporulation protein YqfD [Clostridia bacterium]|nr:sporulation protein YqfD [Clostridia bacterium]